MITLGKCITSASDELVKLPMHELYNQIKNPSSELKSMIEQMRLVRNLSKDSYNAVKKQLPYFVCGIFSPAFRKTENFAYTQYFIIDIDHLSEKGFSVQQLKETLKNDSRVVMCFVSPSGDGLKVMIMLNERCYDAGKFKMFYKLFVSSFSAQYKLQQIIDAKTCDVTRACFLSIDPDVYYNPLAEEIDLNAVVKEGNSQEMWDLFHDVKKGKQITEEDVFVSIDEMDKNLDENTMERIKTFLGTAKQKVKDAMPRYVYVPEILNDIMADFAEFIKDSGVIIKEVIDIQYGKKLRCAYEGREAETNLYYGKKGFSVVETPRCGTDRELNALVADLMRTYVNTL